MTTFIATHEVNDVEHWLASTIRGEVFASIGATVSEFVDPQGGNNVGLVIDVEDVDAMMAMLQSPEAADAMQADGVRPETLVILAKA